MKSNKKKLNVIKISCKLSKTLCVFITMYRNITKILIAYDLNKTRKSPNKLIRCSYFIFKIYVRTLVNVLKHWSTSLHP